MKAFVLTALLAVCFSSNSMAQGQECYPIHPNQEGYNKFCVTLENPIPDNTKAVIQIYKNDKVANMLVGQRVHRPQSRDCTTYPGRCFRRYEALRIVSKNQVVDMEVFMRVHKRSTCLYGSIAIKEPLKTVKLDVECPRQSWENIEI